MMIAFMFYYYRFSLNYCNLRKNDVTDSTFEIQDYMLLNTNTKSSKKIESTSHIQRIIIYVYLRMLWI